MKYNDTADNSIEIISPEEWAARWHLSMAVQASEFFAPSCQPSRSTTTGLAKELIEVAGRQADSKLPKKTSVVDFACDRGLIMPLFVAIAFALPAIATEVFIVNTSQVNVALFCVTAMSLWAIGVQLARSTSEAWRSSQQLSIGVVDDECQFRYIAVFDDVREALAVRCHRESLTSHDTNPFRRMILEHRGFHEIAEPNSLDSMAGDQIVWQFSSDNHGSFIVQSQSLDTNNAVFGVVPWVAEYWRLACFEQNKHLSAQTCPQLCFLAEMGFHRLLIFGLKDGGVACIRTHGPLHEPVLTKC